MEATSGNTPLANGVCPKKKTNALKQHTLKVLLMIASAPLQGARVTINGIYHEDALRQAGIGRRGKPSELSGTHLAT